MITRTNQNTLFNSNPNSTDEAKLKDKATENHVKIGSFVFNSHNFNKAGNVNPFDLEDYLEDDQDGLTQSSHVNGLRAQRKYSKVKDFWEKQQDQQQKKCSLQTSLKVTNRRAVSSSPKPPPRSKMISSGKLSVYYFWRAFCKDGFIPQSAQINSLFDNFVFDQILTIKSFDLSL